MSKDRSIAEIRSLTGLRGVAACLVVLFHYFGDVSGLGYAHHFLRRGYIAVDPFFVLSGFVMALIYGKEFAKPFSLAAFVGFLGRRLGRIYPLYLVVTAVASAFIYWHVVGGEFVSATTIISNVTMTQTWGLAPSIAGPTWSISTEFAAYLLFPILVTLMLTRRAYVCCLVSIASIATVSALCRLDASSLHQVADDVVNRNGPLDIYGEGTPFPLLRCFAGFILGLAAFRGFDDTRWRHAFGWRHVGDLAAVSIMILLVIPGSDVWLEIAFVLLVIALASGKSPTSEALSWGPIYWLGEISYSIYLVHRPVSDLIRNPLVAMLNRHGFGHAYTLSALPPLVLTFIVSTATYYLIERPARDISRRLAGRGKMPPITSETAAP